MVLAEAAEEAGVGEDAAPARAHEGCALRHGESELEFMENTLGFVAREAEYRQAARRIIELSEDEDVRREAEKILAL